MPKLSWKDLSVEGRPAGVSDLGHPALMWKGAPASQDLRDCFRRHTRRARTNLRAINDFPVRKVLGLTKKQGDWLSKKANAAEYIRQLIDEAMLKG